jgi:hypothetical protein
MKTNEIKLTRHVAICRDKLTRVHIKDKKIARLLWLHRPAWMAFKQIIREIYGAEVMRFDADNEGRGSSQIVLRLSNDSAGFDISEVKRQFNGWASHQVGISNIGKRPYENLDPRQKVAVDDSLKAVKNTFKSLSYKAANNDLAEHLVDAITTYLLESNKS